MSTEIDGSTKGLSNPMEVYLPSQKFGEVLAFGYLTKRGPRVTIVVRSGAKAIFHETPSAPEWTRRLRGKLIIEGVWVPVGTTYYRQERNYEFRSLSTASCALRGDSSDGRREWRFVHNHQPVGWALER